MIDLIYLADKQDNSKGKKWARQCELLNKLEIAELEQKELEKVSK